MTIDIFINDELCLSAESPYRLSQVLDQIQTEYPEADYDTDVQEGCVYLTIPNYEG